jgi:hypothetical protein
MEKYIILLDNGEMCIDLHCEVNLTDNLYTVQITDGTDMLHSEIIIKDYLQNLCYANSARYILNRGRIISIIPLEKYPVNFFISYIRIEEIHRHLLRLKKICYKLN